MTSGGLVESDVDFGRAPVAMVVSRVESLKNCAHMNYDKVFLAGIAYNVLLYQHSMWYCTIMVRRRV